MVLGRAYQPPQRQPMDLACHHLETIWQENTTRETSQAVERRPGQILERHDMAEDSTRQGNVEAACWGLCTTTGHNGCLIMMNMNKVGSATALRTCQQLTSQNKRNTSIFCTHSAVSGEKSACSVHWVCPWTVELFTQCVSIHQVECRLFAY